MLRKLLGVFGLLFAVGCCCVGAGKREVAIEDSNPDYQHIERLRRGWEWSEETPKMITVEKIHSGVGP